MTKKILYIDMDGTLIDFETGIARLSPDTRAEYTGRLDEVPGIFALMDPMPGAVDAFSQLSEVYDTYILSTAPWENPSAWQDKIACVREHFGATESTPAYKRLILSHHKELHRGDFLIDDRPNNGADRFEGEWLRFGSDKLPDWAAVLAKLIPGTVQSASGI